MKRLTILTSSALALGLLTASTCSALAEDLASSIVGLWKVTSFTHKDPATGQESHPYGEHPVAYLLFTRGGHTTYVLFGENRKAPAGLVPTDAESAELFKSLIAYSGTYKVGGNTVVSYLDGSWVQSWTGTERKPQVEVSGNKLTITAQLQSPNTGQPTVNAVTFERVE